MAIQLDGTTGISTSGNITAAGTLVVGVFNPTSISATGNVSGTNLNTNGNLSVGGNTIVAGDLTVVGNASLSGNIIGDKITNGSTSVEIPVANGNVSFTIGESTNVVVVTTTGGFVTGVVSATGNITGSNLNASGLSLASNVLSAINSTLAITTSANVSANNVVATNHINASGDISGANLTASGAMSAIGNATAGNILTPGVLSSAGNITGGNILTVGLISSVGSVTSGSNITGLNILTAGLISASGNVIGNNLNAAGLSLSSNVVSALNSTSNITTTANIAGGYFLGNGSLLTGIDATSIQNGTSNVRVVSSGGNVAIGVGGTSNVAVYATTGEYVTGLISASGNIITAANISGGYILGNGSLLTGIDATSIQNGTSNVRVVSSGGNVAIGVGGTSNVAVYATTGSYITGLISATGNITGGNANIGGNLNVTSSLNVDGGTYGNVTTTPFASVWATGAGPNPYSIMQVRASDGVSGLGMQAYTGQGVLYGNTAITFALATIRDKDVPSNLVSKAYIDSTGFNANGIVSASGNVTGGNLQTGGLISATGNITGGNILGGANVNATTHTGTTVSVTANVTGGNILTGGLISATGNITGGNVLTGGLISATGNITGGNILGGANVNATTHTGTTVSVTANVTGGNILTGGLISATGNITGGNVNTNNIVGTGLTLVSNGDLTLSTTGNINANNEYINNVPQPVQNADAANKQYVDNLVSTAISYHSPVVAATITTLATATGGTITYTQPNGVANGVGATLTTTGSFDLIDTANIQTIGTRVLVKDEGNAVFNGVYTWANATAIVRATDADTYGAGSATQLGINDYFFVQSGNVNAGAAYIVNAPSGTITFGTSNITFAEFSKSQIYSANTSAGISLNGTVINALVDNVTTAFSTGNIVVKASANLTTPNIGAATGTSLSTTGNITGGNLSGTSIVGTLTTAAQTNITSVGTLGSLNVTGNISGGNLSGISIVGTLTTASQTNITAVGTLSSLAVTGNATGGNLLTGGLISATGNITGGNVLGGANVNATTHTGTTVSVTANITGGNLLTGGLISATGNISGGNLSGTSIVGTLTTAAQTNITSVGTLGSLAVTGNTTSGNFVGTLNGSGANVTSISATNISSGTLAQARLANASLTVNGTLIALGGSGTVTATATNALTIGTGLGGTSYNGSTGVTITNTGVTSIVAGTNISVSGATGAVTVNVSGTVAAATQAADATNVNGTNANLGYSTSATTVGLNTQAGPQVLGQGGGAAVMSFHRPGAYAINMGLDTDNVFRIGGWSDGVNTYRFQVAAGGAITAATFSGISTQAKYADLSENYVADTDYEPGTVLDFGGNEEITLSTQSSSVRVAGIVSTNPAYLMNSHLDATHVVALALSGRVPTKVTGTIRKGDMMVSDGQGRACACATPSMGTVIGKALENFDGESGTIEIVVGRL